MSLLMRLPCEAPCEAPYTPSPSDKKDLGSSEALEAPSYSRNLCGSLGIPRTLVLSG